MHFKTIIAFVAALSLFVSACQSENKEKAPNPDAAAVTADSATLAQPVRDTATLPPAEDRNATTGSQLPGGVQETVENYVSATGEKVKVTYQNSDALSVAQLEMEGQAPIRLMQQEAWAKGATYTNGKITWSSSGNKATLTKDGNTVQYSVK